MGAAMDLDKQDRPSIYRNSTLYPQQSTMLNAMLEIPRRNFNLRLILIEFEGIVDEIMASCQ